MLLGITKYEDRFMNAWFVSKEEYKGRLRLCKGCDKLNALWQCKTCLCFMPAKARFASSYCPLHIWGRSDRPHDSDPNPKQERIDLDDGKHNQT